MKKNQLSKLSSGILGQSVWFHWIIIAIYSGCLNALSSYKFENIVALDQRSFSQKALNNAGDQLVFFERKSLFFVQFRHNLNSARIRTCIRTLRVVPFILWQSYMTYMSSVTLIIRAMTHTLRWPNDGIFKDPSQISWTSLALVGDKSRFHCRQPLAFDKSPWWRNLVIQLWLLQPWWSIPVSLRALCWKPAAPYRLSSKIRSIKPLGKFVSYHLLRFG